MFCEYKILWTCTYLPKNKNLKSYYPYPLQKTVFLPPKHYYTPWAQEKNSISSTLNFTILQMGRNEWVKFGVFVGIQVSYKILLLEVAKKAPILHNPPYFQEGLFWGNFGLKETIDI
jgi:hypothetical protein